MNKGNSVIFIHPDGTSPSHFAAGRFASVGPDGRLNWDQMTRAGVYLGHMDDQIVATSNGGAVVHAYGIKSFSGSYGLDENGNPYTALSGRPGTTIMEEAIAAGKATAVINSGFIAEPGTGVFLADAQSRSEVAEITAEIVESGVNAILGGGEIHYLPTGTVGRFGQEGIREDGRNLIEEAEGMGYSVVYTLEELQSLPSDTEKVLGIFAAEDTYNDLPEGALAAEGLVDEQGDLILYGQPGNENPPTVAQMLEATLGLELFKNNENGSFVVLEEEGTDNFGNNNNAAGTIEAVLRADEAIGVAQDYIDNVNPNTLLITAADSDGGGLEVDDVSEETVGTTEVQPPFETPIPLDGTTGADTTPFETGAADANGDNFQFGVGWSGVPDVAGSIVSKTYGLNAEKLPATVDNTGIYRLMYETLFDQALAPPSGVPDNITPPPAPTQDTGNVIFIHPDGTSPSHYAAARFASEGPDGRLNWDNMTDAGVYLGHMDDQIVSTSNGGAVVHAFGIKPFAGSYGLDPNGNPYTSLSGQKGTTVMEEAIAAGKPTAVINSGFIAEPGTGVFLADADSRRDVTTITAEIVESGVDVIMGGGEIHYLPVGTVGRFGEEGIREDGRNLIAEAEAMGYTVVYTREDLENLPANTEKVLGIFAAEDTYNDTSEASLVEEGFVDENGELILYGQPGNENPPTVAEMLETTVGLDKFTQAKNGFFVVLEEEGSDNFPNNNNGAGTIEAVLRADAAIGVAQEFVNNVDPNTLVLTAADSDAGGLEVVDVSSDNDTVGTLGVQSTLASFGDEADGIPVPLDGTTGNDTAPFSTGAPDADGDNFEFGLGYVSTSDVAGSIVSKAYGLNSDLLTSTVDNTDMYRIMYQTLFGVAPEEVSLGGLEGFASLPADTLVEGPPAGNDDGEGNPIDANGRTGPFDGQPVQGFSGVQFADSEGSFWFLSDNGFGSQENSADYLLRLYKVDPNFAGSEGGDGSVEVEAFIQLSDPKGLIPFDIQNGETPERLLTGADFDIESFVLDSKGDIWIGEEFGPYLLHFDANGTLVDAPIPTPNPVDLNTLNGQDPLVIGHRGASGVLPEHTLEAYRTAIAQGADFIEPDLVTTKDGVLIARHEPLLDDTTNVAEVFGLDRQSTKFLDGVETTGYFAEDFTLDEIKQLRAVQSRDFRSQAFNGAFEIPTFKEIIELVQEVEAQTGKAVGIYPETKHPTFFDLQGLSLEEKLIDTLKETGFTDPNRLFIQSFEFQNLIELQKLLDAEGLGDIPLVQLYGNTTDSANPEETFSVPFDIRFNVQQRNNLTEIYGQDFLDAAENPLSEDTIYSDLDSPEFLQLISERYAEGAGPWKNNFLLREELDTPVDGNEDGEAEITTQLTGEVTSFVEDAHDAGLQVHPYTLRNEERFLTLNPDGTPQTPEQEIEQLVDIGVDGFFTDFPNTGDQVRDQLVADQVRSPQNPEVQSGDAVANLPRSNGFEGLAISPDRQTFYPMLEGTVEGDPDGSLRIYEFDAASSEYQGLLGRYQLDDASHVIGDFTVVNTDEYLVIERDNNQGEEAAFKKIFKVNLSEVDENGFVLKEELVDLLNIRDPNDLNGDSDTSFEFPFVTIEDVLVLDEDTLLVANDNNYPFSVGRGPDIDNNEIIQIKLDAPLDLDPRVGLAGLDRVGTSGTAFDTVEPAQVTGLEGYTVDPVFTVGETYDSYTPPGILDGLGAFELDDSTVRILANHELVSEDGYGYTLANGTELTGARVSYFDIDKTSRAVVGTGLAYDTIINRAGEVVDDITDLDARGINRLCSAHYIEAEQFGEGRGLTDSLFFTGEEAFGGTEFVLDPATNTLHAVPWMGRAAWENVTELDTGTTDKVALLIGDDREAAPLLMYVGTKDTSDGAGLLERNGLVGGQLYVWAANSGETTPEEYSGTFETLAGSWVEIPFHDPAQADTAVDSNADGDIQDNLGYDSQGFATQAQQDALAKAVGAFQFSRPEDVATNPEDGAQAVLTSTGRDSRFPSDSWGTTYIIDVGFGADGTPLTAAVNAIYDGDDAGAGQFEGPDFGLRSPDNLDWADDGHIYIQEDRSIDDFGLASGEETSIWKLNPDSGELTRVAQVDRSALPLGQSDSDSSDLGNWETSGILDVSELFDEAPGDLMILDVQAHSLVDGVIEDANLVQGGQLAFLEAPDVASI
ncbi:alkaline phosphatase [Acaryochloris sp. IP29b_bin.148]|uniref:alkaline phosphatase n=1 Tax=Acaryochloris sp. IP29b_bin.148 TaxID=2969218 RepID=UPI00262DE6A2|nr:alkaline phosphatase [Acaryochloris sp. IP29b_bin.148]